jgi:hypothetical protein
MRQRNKSERSCLAILEMETSLKGAVAIPEMEPNPKRVWWTILEM